MQRNRVLKLTFSALLVAMSVVLIQFLSLKVPIGGAYSMNIGFGVVPVILGGLLMGPGYGAIIGALADFIKSILFPTGAYFPGFSLSYALIGATPALIMLFFRKRNILMKESVEFPYVPLLICVTISQILYSACMNTYWLSMLMGTGFLVLLPFRLVNQLVLSPVHALIIHIIINRKGVFTRIR